METKEQRVYVVRIDYDDGFVYETDRKTYILDDDILGKDVVGGAFMSFESALRAARKAIEAIAEDTSSIEALVDTNGEYGYYIEHAIAADGYMEGSFSISVVDLPLLD